MNWVIGTLDSSTFIFIAKQIRARIEFKMFQICSFLIGNDGRVYEGTGWHKVTAHTYGYNRIGLGIAFIGDFSGKFLLQSLFSKNINSCSLQMNYHPKMR